MDATGRLSAMKHGVESLSERERETLRLLGRGHDAKGIASALGLSVHTVNERLREVRRKLGVSSSREAARLLLAHEAAERPEKQGYKEIGVATAPAEGPYPVHSRGRAAGAGRPLAIIVMGVAMLALLISLAVALRPGADATASVDVSRPARSMVNPASLFVAADYPPEAMAQRAQGRTRYRLQISETGQAERCEVELSSGSDALDQATCRVMMSRSRFSPALDAAGRPVPATFSGTIDWTAPE